MSVYYSENTFYAHLSLSWNSSGAHRALSWTPEVSQTEEWSIIFGELVAPRLPSLRIDLASRRFITSPTGFVGFKSSIQPLTWIPQQEPRFERTEAPNTELEAFASAVLRAQGNVLRTATTLRLFLLGLKVVMEQHSKRRSDELPATASLYLKSHTELQKYLPHIKLSPTPYIFDFRYVATNYEAQGRYS
jgi:hypothetical protein